MKSRKDAAEAKAERKRKRKAAHDKARQLARAEGKLQPATPESSEEDEEEALDAEDHAPRRDGEGASPPPFYLWDDEEGATVAPEEPRAAGGVIGEPLPRGCGAGVILAGGRRGVACAPVADPWPRGRGGRGVVRAGSLEPPGRHEGCSFRADFEGQHDAPSPEDRHEEAEYERSIWVSISDLVLSRICRISRSCSTRVS